MVLERAHRLIPADKAPHGVRAHVDDDLLWDCDGAPRSWVELSSVEMPREHEDVLVVIFPLPLEVLTQLADAGADAVHSAPAWVAVEPQLHPCNSSRVDVGCVQLTQVEGEPVEDEEDMGARSCAKAGDVLVVRNKIASLGHSERLRANSAICASCWSPVRNINFVLLVVAVRVPGVADPEDTDEAGVIGFLVSLESVNLCL